MRLVLMILAEGQLSEQEAGKEVEVVAQGPGAEVVWLQKRKTKPELS